MKKTVLTILLCWILLLGITGCGTMSKSEMEKKALILDAETLKEDIKVDSKNIHKYKNHIYEVTSKVISIENNYVKLSISENLDDENNYFKVHFNEEDLENFEKGDIIKFIGKFDELKKEKNSLIINIKNAYYVDTKNILEIEYKEIGKTTFEYWDSERFVRVYLINESKDEAKISNALHHLSMNIHYNSLLTSEIYKGKKYSFGGYDAYLWEGKYNMLLLRIVINKDINVDIDIEINSNEKNMLNEFNSTEIQNFLNSIKFYEY